MTTENKQLILLQFQIFDNQTIINKRFGLNFVLKLSDSVYRKIKFDHVIVVIIIIIIYCKYLAKRYESI